MKANPEVERWFAEKKSPAEATIRRLREVILRADRRMTEFVKYGTLTFGYDGDFATLVQVNKKQASVMFNRGARIPGKFPHLEGSGPSARFVRFADQAEVEARAAELGKIVAVWCSMSAAARGSAKTSVADLRSRVVLDGPSEWDLRQEERRDDAKRR